VVLVLTGVGADLVALLRNHLAYEGKLRLLEPIRVRPSAQDPNRG
jgi:hypothetical protein